MGDIVGQYEDQSRTVHGFLLSRGGGWTSFDCESAPHTHTMGVNNNLEIVGYYRDAAGRRYPFYMGEPGGRCFSYEPKGSTGADFGAINDAGEIVGSYFDSEGRNRGFLARGDVFLTFDIVEGDYTSGAVGINSQGDIVGHLRAYGDRMKGFVLTRTGVTMIEFPPGESNSMSCGFNINTRGEIVGHYQRTGEPVRGFLFSRGAYIPIDFPDAVSTEARGINDEGHIVGYYKDKNQVQHGFLLRR